MPNAPATFRMHPAAPKRDNKSAATIARCRKYRTKAWDYIRLEVLARDGMQCQLCGRICNGKKEAHCDHIKAVVDGGTDDMDNLRTLCQSCHSSRTWKDNRPQ